MTSAVALGKPEKASAKAWAAPSALVLVGPWRATWPAARHRPVATAPWPLPLRPQSLAGAGPASNRAADVGRSMGADGTATWLEPALMHYTAISSIMLLWLL